MPLNDRQRRFVDEYLVDLNATQAAVRAGYSEKTANEQGARLLANVSVKAAIAEGRRKLAERTEITQDLVLRRWWAIATADPNDVIQYRRVCCRHCHGVDHQFQWKDEAEFHKALASASSNNDDCPAILPSDGGGYGFDPTADPRPGCTNCHGEGHGEVFASDTRKLTGGAKLLYDGVKVTDRGFEVRMQDRAKALDNVARHLGMFVDKTEITGKDGAPLLPVTKEQRDAAVAAALAADA